jgi:hypothetical protein
VERDVKGPFSQLLDRNRRPSDGQEPRNHKGNPESGLIRIFKKSEGKPKVPEEPERQRWEEVGDLWAVTP